MPSTGRKIRAGPGLLGRERPGRDPRCGNASSAEDGLRVRFEGEVRDDVATVCQLGPNLELTDLERAE